MKHLNKTLAALLAALLLALTACAPAAAPEATQAPEATEAPAATDAPEAAGVTVTDMTGREITLDAPATRVVALSASDCEIIYALGAGELLVGRGEYCDYPAEVLEVPAVQSGAETNIEQIIALEPQVLFMTKMAQTEEQIAALEAAGVHVVVSDAQDIAGVYEAIGMIGTLLGREAEAGRPRPGRWSRTWWPPLTMWPRGPPATAARRSILRSPRSSTACGPRARIRSWTRSRRCSD